MVRALPLLAALIALSSAPTHAQITLTFESIPSAQFSEPIPGAEGAEISSTAARLSASFPLLVNEETQLALGLSWQRRGFEYGGFAGGDPAIDALHEGEVSLNLTKRLNELWSLLTILTPGLASDLEGDLTAQDFNLQAVLAGIRRVSPGFAWGIGAAYSTQFGEPLPLPVALIDWNNGDRWSWMTILPVSSELWYAHSERAQFGLRMEVGGNKYQGDPGTYDVDDPELLYSTLTVGPSARVAIGGGFSLQVDGGFVPYHRFEFFDGSTELESFNVDSTAFLRIGFTIVP